MKLPCKILERHLPTFIAGASTTRKTGRIEVGKNVEEFGGEVLEIFHTSPCLFVMAIRGLRGPFSILPHHRVVVTHPARGNARNQIGTVCRLIGC